MPMYFIEWNKTYNSGRQYHAGFVLDNIIIGQKDKRQDKSLYLRYEDLYPILRALLEKNSSPLIIQQPARESDSCWKDERAYTLIVRWRSDMYTNPLAWISFHKITGGEKQTLRMPIADCLDLMCELHDRFIWGSEDILTFSGTVACLRRARKYL